ncbi:MAG: copper resistance protein NlpE [Bacteroidales bacterium]|jgi:uncharacterized lipoprotein NlpE involved in copper resistance|nr:copper resistance protein NlpE [Bacteroidales bacterium]
MKKIVVVLSVALMMVLGCNNRSQNSSKTSENQKKTAKTEFNYHGKYLGILPCADCEGIETEIELKKDQTFIKKTKYLGKGDQKVFEVTGKYKWDDAQSMVILENITDAPNKYYVTEGAITQLDMDGNVITGDNSMKYRLAKTL